MAGHHRDSGRVLGGLDIILTQVSRNCVIRVKNILNYNLFRIVTSSKEDAAFFLLLHVLIVILSSSHDAL